MAKIIENFREELIKMAQAVETLENTFIGEDLDEIKVSLEEDTFNRLMSELNNKNNEDKYIYINGFIIYTEFIKWASEHGFHKEYKPSIISFYSKIIELDLAIYKVKMDGYINLKFKPSEVYKKLIDKRWLSIMIDENNESNNNEIIDYSHLVVF